MPSRVNRLGPVSVLPHVRADRGGTRRAVSPGGRAPGWSLLLVVAVVAGLLAMHANPFVLGAVAQPPAHGAQAGPAGEGSGSADCPCPGDCDGDVSACPALTAMSWSSAHPALDLADVATSGDAPAVEDAKPLGRTPAQPPIGLRVTAVTVTRI
jgi:hypothetical protein